MSRRPKLAVPVGLVAACLMAMGAASFPAVSADAGTVSDGWIRQLGGNGADRANVVAVDAAGGVYLAGDFERSVDFDPSADTFVLGSAGESDAFVWHLDAAGNLDWARRFGGSGRDGISAIDVDKDGNVYTTGTFEDSVDFAPGPDVVTVTAVGRGDTFVSKMSPDGRLIWVAHLGGPGFIGGSGISVDATGHVLVTGSFEGTIDADPGGGTVDVTSAGDRDVFVWRLDAGGELVWMRHMGGPGADFGFDVAVDDVGSAHVVGLFEETVDADPGPGVEILASAGSSDAFVWTLDGAGELAWAVRFGGTANDIARAVAIDGDGRVITAGQFDEATDFDPGPGELVLTAAGDHDAFVTKLTASGGLIWARQLRSTSDISGTRSNGVAVDGVGNVYTTGWFDRTADFDPGPGRDVLTSFGSDDVFLTKLDSDGGSLWTRQFGGSGADYGYAVATDADGYAHVTGPFAGVGDFDPTNAVTELTAAGSRDAFLVKLTPAGLIAGGAPVCDGRPATIVGAGFIVGTPADDVILGSSAADSIDGAGGDDVICGFGGNDRILGGDGDDRLVGGLGADILVGGGDGDTLVGGPGPDELRGGTGTDTVDYSAADGPVSVIINLVADDGAVGEGDRVDPSVENVVGSRFDDELTGSDVPNRLDGGAGNDLIRGRDGDDALIGGAGDDRLIGRRGSDTLDGGDGKDYCRGAADLDTYLHCETVLP